MNKRARSSQMRTLSPQILRKRRQRLSLDLSFLRVLLELKPKERTSKCLKPQKRLNKMRPRKLLRKLPKFQQKSQMQRLPILPLSWTQRQVGSCPKKVQSRRPSLISSEKIRLLRDLSLHLTSQDYLSKLSKMQFLLENGSLCASRRA